MPAHTQVLSPGLANQTFQLSERFVPWDIAIARYNFGANCGPISFAAALRLEVCDAMQYFPHFSDGFRRWTNSTQMTDALAAAGVDSIRSRLNFPNSGVALIQWLGPWTATDFFSRFSLRYSHWVAVDEDAIFDPNAGRWQSIENWQRNFVPECLANIPRCTGWAVKYGIQIATSRNI